MSENPIELKLDPEAKQLLQAQLKLAAIISVPLRKTSYHELAYDYVDTNKASRIINSALDFLYDHEPLWDLDEPINRYEFIKDILERSNLDRKDM